MPFYSGTAANLEENLISSYFFLDSKTSTFVFRYSLALGPYSRQVHHQTTKSNPLLVVDAHGAAPHVAAAHIPAAAVRIRSPGAAARSRAADHDYRGPAVDSRSHGAGSRAAGSRGAVDSQRPVVDSRGADRHLEVDDRRACSGERWQCDAFLHVYLVALAFQVLIAQNVCSVFLTLCASRLSKCA